jgi:hypothetical protein
MKNTRKKVMKEEALIYTKKHDKIYSWELKSWFKTSLPRKPSETRAKIEFKSILYLQGLSSLIGQVPWQAE